MTSLSEAYGGGRERWSGRDPRHVVAGVGLFVLGALGVVAAILAVTTSAFGMAGDTEAKRLAGTLAGLGIPAILLSAVVVLPSSRRERIGVCIGALLNVGGVVLFRHAYPERWTRTAESLAFPTAMLYFVGGCIALWFVLSAVATFKVRNNPQGTVNLELTRQGETREVQVSAAQYRRYKQALRGDRDEAVAEEIESLYEK
jgi:hypothetical protein